MPTVALVASQTSPRRQPAPKAPPRPLALLDLTKPGEAWAEDYLRRASTGRSPMWRVFGVRREGDALLVAVEWIRGGSDRFALVTLSLVEAALRWRAYRSERAARNALRVGG